MQLSDQAVQRLRQETPGCSHVLHFNNAGAALMSQPVIDATIGHIQREARMGGYEAAAAQHTQLEQLYTNAASLLNCQPQEIAFVENATRAWDMAFYSLRFAPGDRILTAEAEYASNFIAYLQVARQAGVRVEVIPSDAHGQVSVAALEHMLDQHVKLIAITHIPTNGGLVNPAAAIGQVARAAGVPFLLDACQSVGQLPVDVQAIGCDMLSTTGRKFLRGPRGTGLLYVREQLISQLEPPFLDLHAASWTAPDSYTIRDDARRFENWESNVAGRIGLSVALGYAQAVGLAAIWERIQLLAQALRSRLADIPQVSLHDIGRELCGIVTFSVAGFTAAEVKEFFARHQINVTVSDRASTRLDMESRQLHDIVRASVHYYNTLAEIEQVCGRIEDLLRSR